MLRLYVSNSTENPLGWKPWNSRLQGHRLGAYFDANFTVPNPNDIGARLDGYYRANFAVPETNEVGARLSADFPNFASVRTGAFRSRDMFNAPRPKIYAPPELVRSGLAWLGADQLAVNPTVRVTDTGAPMPFDPAEFAPGQFTIPEQANPAMPSPDNPNGGVIVSTPRQICPAWGCNFNPPAPVSSNPSMPTLNPTPITVPSGAPGSPSYTPPRLQTLFAQWQAQQNAAQLALAQQQAAAAASAVAIPVPNVATPAAATASPDYVGEVESWLTQQTLISGVPNWVIGAGVGGLLLFLHKKSGR